MVVSADPAAPLHTHTLDPSGTHTGFELAAVYLTLLADVVIFFVKPLFSPDYIFPWDFRSVQLPMITFLRDQLQQGHFALWNPFSYCGYPVFANIEACYFQPFVLLSVLASLVLSPELLPKLIEWAVVLQVWGAGMAVYHLFLELGVSRPAAWMGAIIFQTGGYFASQTEHIGAVMAVAWMPLTWLAVLRLGQRWSYRWFAILCFALGLSVVGGFPQATLSVYISAVVWAAVLVAFGFSRARLIAISITSCVGGISLAAVQFLPTAQLTANSVAKYRAGWLGDGGGMFPQSLVSLVFPNYYKLFDMAAFKGPGDPTFLYLYCSIIGLLLAVFAVVTRKCRYCLPMLVVCLFGTWLMLGEHAPLWRLLYPLLPEVIRIGIHPEYTYGIFTLSLAALAAMGMASLPASKRVQYLLGTLAAVDLWLIGSGRPMNCASLKLEPGVTREAFEGNPLLLSELKRLTLAQSPPSRIDTVDSDIDWVVNGPITGIPTANGVSPLALENIIQLRLFLHDGDPWGWYYPIENIESPVIDLMGTKYVLASRKASQRMERSNHFRHLMSLPRGNELFENIAALPRFYLVHTVLPVKTLEEARRIIRRDKIDFSKTAIVDGPPLPDIALHPAGTETVDLVDYHADSLSLSVRSAGKSLLVLSESYYPGWRAWIDGAQADVHRVDIALRGVFIPDGSHLVRLEFSPLILPISLALTALTAVALITMIWIGQRFERERLGSASASASSASQSEGGLTSRSSSVAHSPGDAPAIGMVNREERS
jgi:hypothetical protein